MAIKDEYRNEAGLLVAILSKEGLLRERLESISQQNVIVLTPHGN
jgi:hypothetical protein